MLIDDFMPQWDFDEHHSVMVRARPQTISREVRALDVSRSPLVASLLWLRELPLRLSGKGLDIQGLGFSLEDMQAVGFILLADESPSELVLGLAGRFWVLDMLLERLEPEQFAGYHEPNTAKVATNFLVEPLAKDLCRLSTETRVLCSDLGAKNAFRRYWTIIRPFSGLIRREWLRIARQQAESATI